MLRSGTGRRGRGRGRDLMPVNTVLGGDVPGLAQRRILGRGGEGHATAQRHSAEPRERERGHGGHTH